MGGTRVRIAPFTCLTSSWNKHFKRYLINLYSLLWLSGSGNHPLLKSFAIACTLDLGSTPKSEEIESTTDLDKDAGTEKSEGLIMIIIPLVLTLVIIAVIVCVVMIYRRGRIRDAGMSGCIQTDLYK